MLDEVVIQVKETQALKKIDGLFKIKRSGQRFIATTFDNNKIDNLEIITSSQKTIEKFFNHDKENFAQIIESNDKKYTIIINSIPDILNIKGYYVTMEKKKPYDSYIRKIYGSSKNAIIICTNVEKVLKANKSQEIVKQHNLVDFTQTDKHIIVKKEKDDDSLIEYYKTSFRTSTIKNTSNYKYTLFVGDIYFQDSISEINKIDAEKIDTQSENMSKYLELWNKYNEMEKDEAYKKAKEVGTFKVMRSNLVNDGNTLRLEFRERDFNEIIKNNVLSYSLTLCDVNTDAYQSISSIEDYVTLEKSCTSLRIKHDSKISNISKENFTIDFHVLNSKSIENPRLMVSLLGDKSMYSRREIAKKRIATKQTGIPHLIDFFADDVDIVKEQRVFEINERLLNDSNLTPMQKEAVRVICTTPDVAIVQGPPGTGKTTVINHAIEQLASANYLDLSSEIDTLLTAFRHETVTNVKSKVHVCGIPSIQMKNTIDDNNDEIIKLEEDLLDYINDINSKLENKYKDIKLDADELDDLCDMISNYDLYYNTSEELLTLINEISKMKYFHNKTSKLKDLLELKHEIENINSKKQKKNNVLPCAYNLPYMPEHLNDLSEDYIADLEDCSDLNNETKLKDYADLLKLDKRNLKSLYDLRTEIILEYKLQQSILIDSSLKSKIKDVLKKISAELEVDRYQSISGEKRAIVDYMNMMKENPLHVKNTLANYVRVLAATNQQVASKKVASFKNSKMIQQYKNVFIDEAATSPPLDLFIPMVLATERIVLVGDHKQLPNIVSDDYLKNISNDEISIEELENTIGITLFERLFKKLLNLETSNSSNAVKRVVTLDQQFRTHPILGELVSKHFYNGIVKSPLGAEKFSHNYGGLTNEFALWINVPYDKSFENNYRINGSRKNILEAKAIARHIRKSLEVTKEKVSIGIITMFTPQRDVVETELIKEGILDSSKIVSEQYRDILSLEYTTVDASQGKEYDVVYLSIVLAFDINGNKKNYSRLTRSDLLCVALSRQKKLLITVGDKSLFEGSFDEKYGSLCELASISRELK